MFKDPFGFKKVKRNIKRGLAKSSGIPTTKQGRKKKVSRLLGKLFGR